MDKTKKEILQKMKENGELLTTKWGLVDIFEVTEKETTLGIIATGQIIKIPTNNIEVNQ